MLVAARTWAFATGASSLRQDADSSDKTERKAAPMTAQPEFALKQQNFSGVSHLFRANPSHSHVVDVATSGDVRGDVLQEAVDDVLARMPYFADALVEREGDFFYAENPLPFEVAEGQLRAVGGPETNWHNVDVTYRGDTISFSMFHALCDGLGLNLFVEAVLSRYFCRKDGRDYPADGLRVPGSPVLEGEELDPYSRPYELSEGFSLDFFGERYYHLPEVDEAPLDEMRGVSFRVGEGEFMELVRSCQSSPVATLQVLMAEAVTQVHPEVSETLGALVPSSNRKALNSSNTFKNCAGALRLPYRPEQMGGLDFAGRCQLARRLLREANSPDTARFIANNMGGAVRKVGQAMHSYQEKLQVLNFTKTANNDTFMLDYVGGLRSTGFEDQVSSVRYRATTLDPGFRTDTLYLTATAGFFDIELVRAFESDVYVGALADQLRRRGISFTQGEEQSYVTPENGLIRGLGLM